mmetsp:Transcript_41006/g.117837  ORF Transcript_41006/g.117837 Transcript_41006/m.117837 type:complete len:121 (+) Transcript_41006:65-427(+)
MGAQVSSADVKAAPADSTAQRAVSEHPRLLGTSSLCRDASKDSEVAPRATMTATTSGMSKGTTTSKNSKSFLHDLVSTLSDPAARQACAGAHASFPDLEKSPPAERTFDRQISPSTLGRF